MPFQIQTKKINKQTLITINLSVFLTNLKYARRHRLFQEINTFLPNYFELGFEPVYLIGIYQKNW